MNENALMQFQRDLKVFYTLIQDQSKDINSMYEIFDSNFNKESKYLPTLEYLCDRMGLKPDKDALMAICDRVANLKEGSIIQILKKNQKSNSEILIARRFLLNFVSEFYAKRHQELLSEVTKRNLFNEFYREILLGVHQIGLVMNQFFESWQNVLIDGINKDMQKIYGDEETLKLLAPSIDKEKVEDKLICSDRSYSIPKKLGDKFISLPYALAFDIEIEGIVKAISKLILKLKGLEDEVYDKKDSYINYFNALKNAFAERNADELIQKWREVDRCWMEIDTPFQVGHPLEYYEDRYRHSVAPEWDLRVSNPDKLSDCRVSSSIKKMFLNFAQELDTPKNLINFVEDALKNVKIYNGLPTLYYGADMNGLFSAQVVPNDEVISKKFGKKIFAFGDKIIQSAKSKPKMKLSYETFEEDYLKEAREILFDNEELWHLVYDITTNGHEFGHILWIQEDTQRKMNVDGEFKNIEEFKATCGGLVAFFQSSHTPVEFEAVMSDSIRRGVSLMAWREQEEVLPYYCEGLIHLYGAFESGVLEFVANQKPVLRVHKEKYKELKNWYIQIYQSLAQHYIQKFPAGEWLNRFTKKDGGIYHSNLKNGDDFIQWYWERYCQIGQEVL
ncbi:invasion protein CiaB [Helicobacter cappadocius]|uniref:Invasion protein CiaB n=1 Tax=Helicobacter cappadocius TaxID=3063998 RepID=A0AA90PK24_9HELI|nr:MULTISPECIES: invasion protein CiaB [unclassified Helicobacter]MDO7253813.1 invasion protein CiaB [Helicobacter sp. faydin-H75]MDP2539702.1 invasion protein CiaB [Helicobacter sp. faydin-H76]